MKIEPKRQPWAVVLSSPVLVPINYLSLAPGAVLTSVDDCQTLPVFAAPSTAPSGILRFSHKLITRTYRTGTSYSPLSKGDSGGCLLSWWISAYNPLGPPLLRGKIKSLVTHFTISNFWDNLSFPDGSKKNCGNLQNFS